MLRTFLIIFAFVLFPGIAWAVGPHGPYFDSPTGCGACHVSHAAYAKPQIIKPSQTAMCLVCHDGTASIYNVYNAVYGFGPLSGSTHFHPVINTGNPAVGSVIECAYCHNPHGSTPKLLWNYWDKATLTTGVYGPGFCLICHGATDRLFPSVEDPAVSYWVYTLGTHENVYTAHYQEVSPLLPPSGTQVTCVACHHQHASDSVRFLVYGGGVPLCTTCHVLSGSGSVHPVTAFSRTGSVHDVYGITDPATGTTDPYKTGLLCTSCHGPHTVSSFAYVACTDCHYPSPTDRNAYKLTGSYSVLSDPDNTKLSFTGAAGNASLGGAANSTGDLSDFCLRCHDNDPPVATATYAVYVPSTISFANLPPVTTNSGGWANKANYKQSAHGSQSTVITCGECHESHGSNYKCLQRYPEDSTTVDGECLRCHNGLNATWPNAPNVKTDLTSTYHHPTLTVSGLHSNTENYALNPNRHAECADCHDVHQATSPNPLAGVSGVTPNYGTTAWTIPTSYAFTNGATYQYEVCFKCHSYFSYGSTPPLSPTDGLAETDPSVEFNPNNQGYHAVVGPSKVPQFADSAGNLHYYGSYLLPWWGGAQLKCSDCHSGTRRGPHGSANGYILKLSGQALCTSCHDPYFYATYAQTPTGNPAIDGSDSLRSGFSNPSLATNPSYTFQGTTAVASVYNYHPVHANLGCFACHAALPHGWNDDRSLLVRQAVTGRYNGGSLLWNTITVPASRGQWNCTDCH